MKSQSNNHHDFPLTESQTIHDPETLLIDKWIKKSNQSKKLKDILKKKENAKFVGSFTDGSMVSRGTDKMKMGATWIQTAGPFQASLEDWPSSTRAESMAILSVLLTVTRECWVRIKTVVKLA